MRRAALIASNDLRQILRDRKAALYLVFMPIVFTAAFGFAFTDDEAPSPEVVIVAADGDRARAAPVVALLKDPGHLDVTLVGPGDREEAVRRVREEEAHVVVDLSPSALDQLQRGEAPTLSAVADDGRAETHLAVRGVEASLFRAMVAYRAAGEGATLIDVERAVAAWQARPGVERVGLTTGGQVRTPTGFAQFSPGILVQFAIMGVLASAALFVGERRSGTLARMLSGATTRTEVVLGHGAAVLVVGLLQMAILVVAGQLLFGVEYGRSPGAIALVLVALSVFLAGLALAIGVVAKKDDHVVILTLAAMFILSGLGGAWMPLEVTGAVFQRIGHLLPSAWAMDALQNVVVRDLGLSSVVVPCLVILGWAAGLFAVAVIRLRGNAALRA